MKGLRDKESLNLYKKILLIGIMKGTENHEKLCNEPKEKYCIKISVDLSQLAPYL